LQEHLTSVQKHSTPKKGLSGPGKYSGNSISSFATAVLPSPILFNLYLDDPVGRRKLQLITLNFPYKFGERTFTTNLMFADDQLMLKTPYRSPLQALQNNK
jgi:hypothetical protein